MKRLLFIALLAFAGEAFAQGDFGGTDFSDVQLERAGVIRGNYKSGQLIEKMTGGVRMMFLGETEAENVRVNAQEVSFEYPEDNNREPSRILMEGDVRIRVEDTIVDAQNADFDLKSGIARFTGSPVIDAKDSPKLAASLIILNLDTGDFEMHDGVRVPREDEDPPVETANEAETESTP